MDETKVLELITLGVEVAERVLELVSELKTQKGVTSEQLKAYALDKDQAVRDRVDAYLARVENPA